MKEDDPSLFFKKNSSQNYKALNEKNVPRPKKLFFNREQTAQSLADWWERPKFWRIYGKGLTVFLVLAFGGLFIALIAGSLFLSALVKML